MISDQDRRLRLPLLSVSCGLISDLVNDCCRPIHRRAKKYRAPMGGIGVDSARCFSAVFTKTSAHCKGDTPKRVWLLYRNLICHRLSFCH